MESAASLSFLRSAYCIIGSAPQMARYRQQPACASWSGRRPSTTCRAAGLSSAARPAPRFASWPMAALRTAVGGLPGLTRLHRAPGAAGRSRTTRFFRRPARNLTHLKAFKPGLSPALNLSRAFFPCVLFKRTPEKAAQWPARKLALRTTQLASDRKITSICLCFATRQL